MESQAKQEKTEMTATAQMHLRDYAGRSWPADSHKARILYLARKLRWGHRRTRAIYNGETGVSLRAEEYAAIKQLTEARHEYRTIEALCAGLEALLSHTDEAGYRAQIDALRQVYRGMGGAGVSGAGR